MLFIIIPSVIFILGTLTCYFLFIYKLQGPEEEYQESIENIDKLLLEKKNTFKEIAGWTLGLVDNSYYQELNKQVDQLSQQIKDKKANIIIAEKKITQTEIGLKDAADIDRELEISQIESKKEKDLLQAQESDINNQNILAKQELEHTVKNVSEILLKIEGSKNLIDNLSSQTEKAGQKLQHYQVEIELLNKKYIELKTEYEALDIEYAKLYEKSGG